MRSLRLAALTVLLAPALAGQQKPPALLGHWQFSPDALSDNQLADTTRRTPATLHGRRRFVTTPPLPGLWIADADDRVVVAESLRRHRLPKRAMSVAAWVVVDAAKTWGGIASCLQDNGGFEQGWLLGFRDDRFAFALASEGADDGDGVMTYLVAKTRFVPGERHHVVGTYDGAELRIYVDGELQGSSAVQHGDILYPRRARFELGAYVDDNERYPLGGVLGAVALFDGALTAAAVADTYTEQAAALPEVTRDATPRWQLDAGALAAATGSKPRIRPLPRAVEIAPAAIEVPALSPVAAGAITLSLDVGDTNGEHTWLRLGEELALGLRQGRPWARVGAGDRAVSCVGSTELLPHTWHHVAVTWQGGVARLFVDGTLAALQRTASAWLVGPGVERLVLGEAGQRLTVGQVAAFDAAVAAAEISTRATAVAADYPRPRALARPMFIRYLGANRIEVRWRDAAGTVGSLECLGDDGSRRRLASQVGDDGDQRAEVDSLAPRRTYWLRVVGEAADGHALHSEIHTLETAFNFTTDLGQSDSARDATHSALATRSALAIRRALAAHAQDGLPTDQGYAVLVGGDATLAVELARTSRLRISMLETDLQRAATLRQELAESGLYGNRVTVLCHAGLRQLVPEFANLVLVPDGTAVNRQDVLRVLRPCGGIALVGHADGRARARWTEPSTGWRDVELDGNPWSELRRGALPDTADWSHQYGNAAHTASSGDQRVHGALELQWFGEPGPRPMLDRGCRSPAPLASSGRLYIPGDRRIFGVDAYNGTVRFTVEMPAFRRVNTPRDSSNMAASGDALFVAIDDELWELDGDTGARRRVLRLPSEAREHQEGRPAWGVVAVGDDWILGSITRHDAIYRGADGEWYDGSGAEAEQVLGTALFVLERDTGELRWMRPSPALLHPTVAVIDDAVFFVEDRHPTVEAITRNRLVKWGGAQQHLVGVELGTGLTRFERAADLRRGKRAVYFSVAQGTIVVLGTSDAYYLWGFDASTGQPLWQQQHAWTRDHHGGTIQHPVLLDGVVYAERKAYDLRSGALRREDLPERRGCGTMSASGAALFYRHYHHGIWDLESDTRTELHGIRSGCWLGLIPAGGLLLAPESSSGCSCAIPIQASAAFRPRAGD